MGDYIGKLAGNSKNMAMQQSLQSNTSFSQDLDVDWKLAGYIYNFLIGKSDKLPNYEYMVKFMEAAETDTVSVGYGLDINKNLEVVITEPISIKTVRLDVITPTNYEVYEKSVSFYRAIDANEFPKFDVKRIKNLQKYLVDFLNYQNKKNQEEFNSTNGIGVK